MPVRYSFTCFSRNDASDEKRENLLALLSDGASPEQARGVGDVFLAGYQFKQRSLLEISRQFGDDFAYGFASQAESLGEWVGPIQSIFGSHWVWVDDIAESRVKSFTEVAQDLRRDIRRDLDDRAIQDWSTRHCRSTRCDYDALDKHFDYVGSPACCRGAPVCSVGSRCQGARQWRNIGSLENPSAS